MIGRVARKGSVPVFAVVVALGGAPAARADSDPASDFLPTQSVYLPYQPKVSDKLVRDLRGVTAASVKSGYPVKVALIASESDLGGVPALFGKPDQYATYLGQELADPKTQLLVAMPAGFGTYPAKPTATAAIADLKGSADVNELARTAVQGVQKLASAGGHPIRGFKPASGGGGGSSGAIFAIPVVILALVLGVVTYRRFGEMEEDDGEPDPEPRAGT